MVGLLDVNVLIALLVPEHEHHATALEWFTIEAGQHGWATCAVTELGVIRVCAQLPGGAWPPETAADRLLRVACRRQSECEPQGCPAATSIAFDTGLIESCDGRTSLPVFGWRVA